ncbi:MAG: hypothetical protein ACYS47_11500 [Planctomycetota bacterium]|jgi:hypothetical protein
MVRKGFLIAAGVLCFVLAAYLVYRMFSGPKEYGPKLSPIQMRLTENLVPDALGDMRTRLPKEYFRAVLLPFGGDNTAHHVRKIVKSEIVREKHLFLQDLEEVTEEEEDSEGWTKKVTNYVKKLIGESVGSEVLKKEEKIHKAAKAAKMHGLVTGDVDFNRELAGEARLDLTLVATDAEGKQVFKKTYTERMRKSLFDLEYYRIKVGEMGVGWKLLIWVVLTLGLPVVTFFIPAKAMKSDSNGAILAALVGYTVADGIAAMALMGFAISGFFSFLILLVALVLAGIYNYGIFTEIKDFV